MKYSEIVKRLVEYYLQQDPALIARLLANATIDHYRLENIGEGSEAEIDGLCERLSHNNRNFAAFVQSGFKGALIIDVEVEVEMGADEEDGEEEEDKEEIEKTTHE
jgi:hypothetical protein